MRIAFFIAAVWLLGCRKESFTSNPDFRLTVFADTLKFDTVFTSTGSATQAFNIFNNNEKGIRISSIRLTGSAASPFQINSNGQPGPQATNLELAANDSAYVFVTVRINPNAANQPFVVRDSIEIQYNGNRSVVQLEAYGQNAHFFRNRTLTQDEVWTADKPYVLLGGLQVAANTTLTINEGCRIYLHADAPLIVHGTLQAQGNRWDSTRVLFAGDRLDAPYNTYPAAWPGIVFTNGSQNNVMRYVIIKNAYQGLVLQGPAANTAPKLVLAETIIDNAFDAGLLAVNSSIEAQNVLISNCGKNLVLQGGTYRFDHCTIAAASNAFINHKEPVLRVSDASVQNGQVAVHNLSAHFRNCIFWGEGSAAASEIVVSKTTAPQFNLRFDHVLWQEPANPAPATVVAAINAPPEFETIDNNNRQYNFRLKPESPALNKGLPTPVATDLDGAPRPVGLPDLGAYERQ